MSVTVPSDVPPKIDAILASGKFAGPDDVIRKAVDALAEREAFIAEVQASFDQLEAGGGTPLDDFLTQVQANHSG